MPIDFSQIIKRTLGTRAVRVLKRLRKPFALWPIVAAFARPFRRRAVPGRTSMLLIPRLRKSLPAWSLLLMLLIGAGVGFYASTIFNQVAGTGESTAPDFAMGANPASMSIPQGSLAAFTISLSSQNSFAGSINMNYSLSPGMSNVTIALNPNSVSLLTGAGFSTLTISIPATTPLNTYTIVVDGTSGRLSHNVTSIFRVVTPPSPDFSITASPSPMNITQGSAGGSTITLVSIGGFGGTVNLSVSIWPSNAASPTLILNPNRVTLSSGGTGNSVLTINATGGTSRGIYTIVVLGVSGTLANTVSITLTVQ